MCADIAATTIVGRRRVSIIGPTRMCCRISGGKSIGRAAPAPIAAAMGRSRTIIPQSSDPINDAILEAGQRAGFPFTADYNGAQQEGFCRSQSTIKDGRRCSAAVAYLHPALAVAPTSPSRPKRWRADRLRRPTRRRHRIRATRRGQNRPRRSRSHSIRRRDQLAAIADAFGYRRCRRACAATVSM